MLAGPEFPVDLAYLWGWSQELEMARPPGHWIPTGGGGQQLVPGTVTWQDLDAWARLTGERVSAMEARALLRLTRERAKEYDEEDGANA